MRIISFLLISVFYTPADAQSVKTVLDAIVRVDADYFNKYFATTVMISIDQDEQMLSKEQAIEKLKTFVLSSAIKSTKIIHEGVAKGKDASMGIGGLISDKAKFRVYISSKNIEGNKLIHELKFEKDIL